jgi:hypothetical protein
MLLISISISLISEKLNKKFEFSVISAKKATQIDFNVKSKYSNIERHSLEITMLSPLLWHLRSNYQLFFAKN